MDIVLIPGFWLDGASWDEVAAPLRDAGHTVHALTLPGKESRDADRSGIGLRDHVDAVVAVVDSLPGPVVLVGHSGGGAIAHAVVDARPDAIARVVYVDSGPLADGGVINDELPVADDEVPLPDWSAFGEEDLVDLDEPLRERLRSIAVPEPLGVTRDPQVLTRPASLRRPGDRDLLRVPDRAHAAVAGRRPPVRRRAGPGQGLRARRPAHRALAAADPPARAGRGDPRGGGPLSRR